MALETKRVSIDDTAYTILGTGVTTFSATEYRVGSIRAVVVPTGDPAPLVGETDYVEWDDTFTYASIEADIYMMSPLGQAWIGLVSV